MAGDQVNIGLELGGLRVQPWFTPQCTALISTRVSTLNATQLTEVDEFPVVGHCLAQRQGRATVCAVCGRVEWAVFRPMTQCLARM
jgi:hypothetical protein